MEFLLLEVGFFLGVLVAVTQLLMLLPNLDGGCER